MSYIIILHQRMGGSTTSLVSRTPVSRKPPKHVLSYGGKLWGFWYDQSAILDGLDHNTFHYLALETPTPLETLL